MITHNIDYMPKLLLIGVQGENGVLPVRINAASWLTRWPDMQLTVWATLPGGKAAYQVQSHMEGAVLVWDVTSADTSVQGVGTVEIVGVSDDMVKKTGPIRTSICKTSTTDTTTPPEQQQPWYTAAMDALKRAESLVGPRLTWADLGESKGTVAVLPEQVLSFAQHETYLQADASISYTNMKAGDTVHITIDGTQYDAVLTEPETGYLECGNATLLGGDFEDTGEPYFVGFVLSQKMLMFVLPLPVSRAQIPTYDHTVSFSVEGTVVKPVPMEYMPIRTAIIKEDGYDNYLAGVQAAASAAITFTCTNMTFDEAFSALCAGEPLDAMVMIYSTSAAPMMARFFPSFNPGTREIVLTNGEATIIWNDEGIQYA